MQVQEIWRYPVKSMQGERLSRAALGPTGLVGDRGWALFDTESGAHLTARRQPELLAASARLVGDDTDPAVLVTLPDGSETDRDETLSAWLGRKVRLERARAGVSGRFETQAPGEVEQGEWFTWEGPEGSFHDSSRAPLSLVGVGAFRDWDRRRFRINVVLDEADEPGLVGQRLAIGSSEVEVLKQIDRCVMTTRPQPAHTDAFGSWPAIGRDVSVLTTINRERETFLGVGARTHTSGTIAIGDPVDPLG